jgi:uncharacterized membrane protein YeiH
MGRYVFLLPAVICFVLVPVLLMVAPALERGGRRLALLVAVALLTFSTYGVAKTYAAHERWLCVVHHAGVCNGGGHGSGPTPFELWMVRHFG